MPEHFPREPGESLPLFSRLDSLRSVSIIPGTLREGGVDFPTTHWNVIAGAPGNKKLLTQLCRDYWPPLYTFLRRRGYNPADAQDLVQGFFAHFLESRAYSQTNQAKGKFRHFLLASLRNYIADVWDRDQALKRGCEYEFLVLEDEIKEVEEHWAREFVAETLPEERLFEQAWADTLVTRALHRLEEEIAAQSKRQIFGELKPFLCGGPNLPPQAEVAARLAMPLETLRSHLSRLRARYRSFLRDEVKRTVGATESVDDELRHLCSVLTTAC